MRLADYAIALNGGTQIFAIASDDGNKTTVRLDGRMDSFVSGKQLFIGNAPDNPDTRWPPYGGNEALEIISLLEKWLDKTQGFLLKEALLGTNPHELKGQDLLDRMGMQFLFEVQQRDVA